MSSTSLKRGVNDSFYYFPITIYDSLIMFRFTTAGESHGKALVAIVEGLPAGLPIDIDQINHELRRRQQGYGRGGRMKIEKDEVAILSGVRHGATLGSPVALMIEIGCSTSPLRNEMRFARKSTESIAAPVHRSKSASSTSREKTSSNSSPLRVFNPR